MRRKISPEISSETVILQLKLPILIATVFLALVNRSVRFALSKKAAIMNNGNVMPTTYAKVYNAPHTIVPLATPRVNTPANTGAQHVVAIAEKIQRTQIGERWRCIQSPTEVGE